MEATKKILSVKDLQTELNISKERAYVLMHNKAFPSFKIGKQYYVSAKNLDDWLNKTSGRRY